jgi:hypothetical protein
MFHLFGSKAGIHKTLPSCRIQRLEFTNIAICRVQRLEFTEHCHPVGFKGWNSLNLFVSVGFQGWNSQNIAILLGFKKAGIYLAS